MRVPFDRRWYDLDDRRQWQAVCRWCRERIDGVGGDFRQRSQHRLASQELPEEAQAARHPQSWVFDAQPDPIQERLAEEGTYTNALDGGLANASWCVVLAREPITWPAIERSLEDCCGDRKSNGDQTSVCNFARASDARFIKVDTRFSDVIVIDSQTESRSERAKTKRASWHVFRSCGDVTRRDGSESVPSMTLLVISIMGLLMSFEDASRTVREFGVPLRRRRNVNRLTHAIDNRQNLVAELYLLCWSNAGIRVVTRDIDGDSKSNIS